jgi:thiamine-phosphate pyrophosphorylase
MRRRQTVPTAWLIVADQGAASAVAQLSRGSEVLLLASVPAALSREVRRLAGRRGLVLVQEGRGFRRVHSSRELRSALLRRTPLVLLSPLYPTSTHPGWKPLPRMRAAALARLGGRKLIALGGMNERRYVSVAALGFSGWAGISAFRT